MNRDKAVVVVGEGMLELSRAGKAWQLAYGGDTLNTAIHLARMGVGPAYMTALGTDPFSEDLLGAWSSEGIDTRLVLTDPERHPGLYAIRTDERGERSFQYWRSASAATRLFELPGADAAVAAASKAQLLVFSLISLAILSPAGRLRLLDLARAVRSHGGIVAFDGNYRPKLWSDPEDARQARDEAISCCNIGLPTLADEQSLSGQEDPRCVAAHWRACGAAEVAVKLGEQGCFVGNQIVPVPAPVDVVDTSGAGGAFNAAYLAARLSGKDCEEAALAGHLLAAWVIARPGALPPRDAGAPYAPEGSEHG